MKLLLVVNSLLFASFLTQVSAQTSAPATNAAPPASAPVATTAPTAPSHPMIFHPPGGVSGGVLPIRVGGGSRGGADDGLSIQVLVPEQVALTTQDQPSLYWYQNKPAKTQCEVTVTEPKNPKPLLMLKTGAQTPAGIHAIRLSKFNVKLKPDVTYKWSIAVVTDPSNRSLDIVANGVIKRIAPTPDLASKLAQASDADKASIYAENGIWYDALQSISDQIDKSPKDTSLRQERAELLDQVGMKGASMDADLSGSQ
jgi:hypothetical protein